MEGRGLQVQEDDLGQGLTLVDRGRGLCENAAEPWESRLGSADWLPDHR